MNNPEAFLLMGKPGRGKAEQVDTAETRAQARALIPDYKQAFGSDWRFWVCPKPAEKPQTFRVFVRNWWRYEGGQLVPDPRARKHTLAKGLTEGQALGLCKVYNEAHKPGPLSRKAEFTAE